MIKINPKLLGLVLGCEITTEIVVDFAEIDGVKQEWQVVKVNGLEYPLDFIIAKCKKWAYVMFTPMATVTGAFCTARLAGNQLDSFVDEDEPRAVLLACDWIIKASF